MDTSSRIVSTIALPAPRDSAAFVSAILGNSYSCVISACFLTWDILINLDDEVEYIWLARNSWLKYLYIFVRYIPLFTQGCLLTISTSIASGLRFSLIQCRGWMVYEGLSAEVIVLVTEIILLVRVYAMYNRSKIILWTLTSLFITELVVTLTMILKSIPYLKYNNECMVIFAPHIYSGYWLASLAFETILFLLTIVKLVSDFRRSLCDNSIIHVIMRDGTWAYALVFVILLLNLSMYRFDHSPHAGIFYSWHLTVMSFAGTHLLLNLRRLSGSVHLTTPSTARFSTDIDVDGYQSTSVVHAYKGQGPGHGGASGSRLTELQTVQSIPEIDNTLNHRLGNSYEEKTT